MFEVNKSTVTIQGLRINMDTGKVPARL